MIGKKLSKLVDPKEAGRLASSQDEREQHEEKESLRIVLRNELSELNRLHEEIGRYGQEASLSMRDVQHCVLALEEVVTNVIQYGYPAADATMNPLQGNVIICDLVSDGHKILLKVTDCAIPYNPLDRSDPDVTMALEERVPGGLGVYLVKQVMDEVTYERVGNHNILVMLKKRTDGGQHEYST
jgi:serine/threonine-protein kinase RsbW